MTTPTQEPARAGEQNTKAVEGRVVPSIPFTVKEVRVPSGWAIDGDALAAGVLRLVHEGDGAPMLRFKDDENVKAWPGGACWSGEPVCIRFSDTHLAQPAVPEGVEGGWRPIATAPDDGRYVLLGNENGAWVGRHCVRFESGYSPEFPWQNMMLNCHHMPRLCSLTPTHWQPLPAPPATLSATRPSTHGRAELVGDKAEEGDRLASALWYFQHFDFTLSQFKEWLRLNPYNTARLMLALRDFTNAEAVAEADAAAAQARCTCGLNDACASCVTPQPESAQGERGAVDAVEGAVVDVLCQQSTPWTAAQINKAARAIAARVQEITTPPSASSTAGALERLRRVVEAGQRLTRHLGDGQPHSDMLSTIVGQTQLAIEAMQREPSASSSAAAAPVAQGERGAVDGARIADALRDLKAYFPDGAAERVWLDAAAHRLTTPTGDQNARAVTRHLDAAIDAVSGEHAPLTINDLRLNGAPAPVVQVGDGVAELSVWGTQYPGKMPRLHGTRQLAELNWQPFEGADLICMTVTERYTPGDYYEDRAALARTQENGHGA